MLNRLFSLLAAVSLLLVVDGCSRSSVPSIQNKGSDTMIEVAQAWAEAYDGASVEVSGGGSGVGISALIGGTVDVANASRHMKPKEEEDAKKATGKEPILHVVGYDALAVYVHKDNPIEKITIAQLAEIYGDGGGTSNWSQIGVTIPGLENDEIVRVSRQNNSGTYEYFKESVLGKGRNYKLGSIDAAGSKDLVKTVAQTPGAIGYSGMGYKTDEVRFVPVAKEAGGPAILPSVAAVHDNTYPISRPLYQYTLGEATGAIKDYLDWVRSSAGQKILADIGYVPLPPDEQTGAPSAGETQKSSASETSGS